MQRSMYKYQERRPKPLIDEYEAKEFDNRLFYAMEHSLAVRLAVWVDGFTNDVFGCVHQCDPITHEVHIELKPGEFKRIKIEDIIGAAVID
jgi:hypothetical protein